jgi:hypothetical protein
MSVPVVPAKAGTSAGEKRRRPWSAARPLLPFTRRGPGLRRGDGA